MRGNNFLACRNLGDGDFMPTKPTIHRARKLRQKANTPEALAWSSLRILRKHGFPVRRQHPIGPYIVDFAILSRRLVIEVDGSVHNVEANRRRDKLRDSYLIENGWTVLRLTTDEAMSKDYLLGRVTATLGL